MRYISNNSRYDSMEYRKCGESGLKLPKVSLGMWHNFGKNDDFDNMKEMCFTAFDNGITHFDLANNYGFPDIGSAEENTGRILKQHFSSYRNELIISTKAGYRMWEGPYGDFGSRKYLLSSLDDSLKRLKLDYVDIFYHHRPDPDTPLYETIGALDQAVKSGKALYAGLSNYDGKTMEEAVKIFNELKCPFVINQNRYSILDRTIENNGLLKSAEKQRKGVIVFSPLAQGVLTDKYLKGIPKDSRISKSGIYLKESNITPTLLGKVEKLNNIAKERGETLAQMALSWVLCKEQVTSVLIGASSPRQILENVKILKSKKFSEDELRLIDEISKEG
ncbi:MAG: aldo/keto reductase [Clostridia bacterium]|nr:aldo/keto reductase [Clostridia bacterium]